MQWPCLSAIRSTIVDNETTNINETSISADTDGPHDAASRKIIHIALSTEYNYQARSNDWYQIATQTEKY